MPAITHLPELLAHLSPELRAGEYVYATVPHGTAVDLGRVVGTFREAEGLTLILPREEADLQGLAYDYVAAWITLSVHSALAAVGLTAAVATALAAAGISCNVVAGFHHDHLFVGVEDGERAVAVLRGLAAEHRALLD